MMTENMFPQIGFYLDYFEWRNLLKNFIPDWDVFIMAVTNN